MVLGLALEVLQGLVWPLAPAALPSLAQAQLLVQLLAVAGRGT